VSAKDKVEPFWSRPVRLRRRTAAPGSMPPPPDNEPPATAADTQAASPDGARAARRSTIAALIADAAPPIPKRAQLERAGPAFAPEAQPSPAPAAGGWIRLSEAEAAEHPLSGVGGWLVALAILLALGLLRALFEIIDFWATTDHGGLSAWIMAILRSGMALWAALVLGLLLGRSRAFPINFIAYGMVNIIYLGLFGLAFAHLTNNRVFVGVAAAIVVTLIAMLYVVRSRRVNVTYLRRLRVPKSKRGAARMQRSSQPV
jgi:hypothetical protein